MKPSFKPSLKFLVASLILNGACEGNPPPLANAPKVAAPVALVVDKPPVVKEAPSPPPSPVVVGMTEPFKLMNAAGVSTLDRGWKALRRKDYAEARAAFHEVVTAYPDKPAARFAELRAAVLAGDLPAVPALWQELLARDYVGYAHRLDTGKEMAPLRKSPEWPVVKAITAEMKKRHLSSLEEGFFFVGRLRPSNPLLTGAETEGEVVKLALEQEVYHFNPRSERLSRVSDTGGKVLAIHQDGERRQLMVLTGGSLKKKGGELAYAEAQASVIALASLDRTGPLPIAGDTLSVDLCFSDKGEPVFVTLPNLAEAPSAFTLDASGTSLVGSEQACGGEVATTRATPAAVEHRRAVPEGVALSEDGLRLDGVDEELPVRASSAIRAGSFGWSPGKKRFVYSGSVERCPVVADTEARNGLFVWDAERKRSTRVSAAPTGFESAWVDDDRLVYQAGTERATKLTLHDFSRGGLPVTVKVPSGAGLFGIAAVGCAESPLHAQLP